VPLSKKAQISARSLYQEVTKFPLVPGTTCSWNQMFCQPKIISVGIYFLILVVRGMGGATIGAGGVNIPTPSKGAGTRGGVNMYRLHIARM